MKAVTMRAYGGSDVLEMEELPDRQPRPGEISVAPVAIGVNFMDIGIRRGMMNVPLPHIPGVEGSGRIVALGADVEGLVIGQRVAWVYAPGSYADRVIMPAGSAVPIPDDIDDRTAASLMMQGLTASHFATDFYPVQVGDVALVHAAAGGLGQILTQIIRLRGGRVIGRVSSGDKVAAAKAAGAEHVIVDANGDFADAVLGLTDGRGVDVVYDGSGPATFEGSLASLRSSGTFCWYGPVLGAPADFDLMKLPRSIKLGYAVFFDHIPTPDRLRARTAHLFDWVRTGQLTIAPATTFPLADAAIAHAAMESRATTGKLLLLP
ncbi:Zn-dependent oxidoreductase, NADPH:quinone reductase [Sphingobium yanoikuyae]|uniref:Zn-dependent oxidoreductase, NADPH:quinone reductase n=1 Tax=Sphingobium yanoikuyae TaxID=13690 RepID=A0A084EQD1_SPHYA|nr:quinone oxidoreductase [Sphingobium yanoikuyae]KEZ20173.1 Zn-dependent oxidoreductase, NADPH:quinone reductase [Sphingobium yanoikuyae]